MTDPQQFGTGAESFKGTTSYKRFAEFLDKLKSVQAAREKLNANPFHNGDGQKELQSLERKKAAAEAEAKAARDVSTNASQAVGPAVKIAQAAQWTANGFERGAKALDKIKPIAAPKALQDQNDNVAAHGGTIRRFASGGNVGTDTVRAMLTPGEVVLNAKTSHDFFPQLTALNAGSRAPSSYPTSSITNVGDVYLGGITVPGGPTTAATARALADMTRRELRRRS